MSCLLDLCLLNGIVYQPEGCETPCWFPLLKRWVSHVFIDLDSCCVTIVASLFHVFSIINWLFGTQHAYEDINLLGAWDTFFKATPNILWVGSFLGSFHSTFSAWQSQSLSRSHVWYIFDLDFNPECFSLMCLIFLLQVGTGSSTPSAAIAPSPKAHWNIRRIFWDMLTAKTCWETATALGPMIDINEWLIMILICWKFLELLFDG